VSTLGATRGRVYTRVLSNPGTGAGLRVRPGLLLTILYSKLDARGHARRVQDGQHDLAFTYDAAERLTQVAQADASGTPGTPVVTAFSYATANGASNWKNGKLETATAYNPDLTGASVVETYTYGGTAGRVSARQTQVEGRTINQSFAWTDLGPIGTLGYPDDTVLADPARPVSYGYSLGYLTSVGSFLTSVSYHANGMVHEALHANGMKDVFARDANDMPRPAQISVQRVSDGVVLGSWGPYDYDGSGNVKTIGADTFTYDLVSRLMTGTTTAGANRQCADYNAFGALKALGTGTTTCTASPIAVDNATNRLSSPALYDAAGNLTNWGGYAYSWNRLNQMYATTGTGINRSYGYTADGERILERNALDDTRTLWIRDLSGRVLREYGRTGGGTWSWSKDYVHRDGAVVSTVTPSGTRHLHLDHLGSVRGASDTQVPPQPILPTVRDYYPFGLDALAGTDAERMRFAGHERDTRGTLSQTDDLDYMHARYYSPVVGRFLSIDPGRDWNAREPQSWNLFSYVRNNPVTFTDPTGMLFKVAGEGVQDDLCGFAGLSSEQCGGLVKVAEDGTVSLNATDDQIAGNEGLVLINDLVSSDNVYLGVVGTTMPIGTGSRTLGPGTNDYLVMNLSVTKDDRPARQLLPPAGFHGAVGIFAGISGVYGAEGRPVHRASILFHELAENYAKTEKRQQYGPAHSDAIVREIYLRMQHPGLERFGFGAGPYVRRLGR